MRCLCPKCNAGIELEQQEIPAEGSFNKCPECNANYLLRQESFARRALHKGNDITCAECGSQLGPEIFCRNCHALYPDYFIARSSSPAKKQLGKILVSIKSLNNLFATKAPQKHAKYNSDAQATLKKKGTPKPGKPLQLAAIIVILIIFMGAGGFYYYKEKLEADYSQNYIRAVYGVKSAGDMSLSSCAKISAEWRLKQPTNVPRLTGADKSSLLNAKKDVDTLIQQLEKTPDKYTASRASLDKLYSSYVKLQTLAIAPSGTQESFAEAVKKLDEEFKKGGKELKAGLPPRLSKAFNDSLVKYRALKEL